MPLPTTKELVAHCLGQLKNRPKDWKRPFPVHHVTHFLPESVLAEVRKVPVKPKDMTGARAHNNANRTYFTQSFQAEYPVAKLIADVFQHPDIVKILASSCKGDLDNTHLLLELACDQGPSNLVPHRDIGTKRFTGLFYVANDPRLKTAGTDIYTAHKARQAEIVAAAAENGDAPRQFFKDKTRRVVYGPGIGYYFVPTEVSWHGFDAREIVGERKTLIVNYLGVSKNGEHYRNVQNLCFPDKPVRL
jgi:hypothetical protein